MIKIFCRNGLSPDILCDEILRILFNSNEIQDICFVSKIEESNLIVSYPYGSEFSRPAHAVTVAYICENYRIGSDVADFHFYVSRKDLNLPNSCRIQWHSLEPSDLSPPSDIGDYPEKYISRKFCNFVYKNKVGYREYFFDMLSKYKKIDAPSASRKNCESIEKKYGYNNNIWENKRKFISEYKFTIAFENDVFPGYETEKLYDAIRVHTVPVYFGNPFVGEVFNLDSFISAGVPTDLPYWLNRLEEFAQIRLSEGAKPFLERKLSDRARAKFRRIARDVKNQYYIRKLARSLVETIIEFDRDDDAYIKLLSQPKVKKFAAEQTIRKQRDLWIKIFETVEKRS